MNMKATIDLSSGHTVQSLIGFLAQLPPAAKVDWDDEDQLLLTVEWKAEPLANPQDLR